MFNRQLIESYPEHEKPVKKAASALDGLLVIDFTHFVAGPVTTMMLADFGARVIKIESPNGGDGFRKYPPHDRSDPEQGAPFIWANRNKASIALNLKKSEGVRVSRELVAKADVVVENFSTGVMDRLGLGYESLAEANKKLIYCAISAYGRVGEYSKRIGFDPIVQAESGFLSMNGYPDRPGVRSRASVMDIGTGLVASNAIAMALCARNRDGVGQFIEVPLFDTSMLMTGFGAMQCLTTGSELRRDGNESPDAFPSGVFRCADREFYMTCGTDSIFRRLFEIGLGRPDVANDIALQTCAGRLEQRERLLAIINMSVENMEWSTLSKKLTSASVPHGPVNTLMEALQSDLSRSRKLVSRVRHPTSGWVPNIRNPIQLSRTPAVEPRPAPTLGENTEEVLRELLRYSDADIARCREAGVFDEL